MFKVTLDREEPRSSKLIINPHKIAFILASFLQIFHNSLQTLRKQIGFYYGK